MAASRRAPFRILIVEDNLHDLEMTRSGLERYLEPSAVVHVRNGVEALKYLRGEEPYEGRESVNPAVILLDLNMPKMGGIQFLDAIRADASLAKIPVIVMTTSQEERDLESCAAHGVKAYVVKPVVFVDFLEAAHELGLYWSCGGHETET